MIDRRAFAVGLFRLRPGPHQFVQVAGFELVGIPRQGGQVADAVVAGAGLEGVVKGEGGQHRVAAGTAALDQQPLRVREVPGHQIFGAEQTSSTLVMPQLPFRRSR